MRSRVVGGVVAQMEIPLFPLHTVLFPGGPLPLRIFEPRYLDMVSECLRSDSGFGVSLIREGREMGPAATTYEVGTLGRISYWHKRNDGLLGITVTGEQRFRILEREVRPDQLVVVQAELMAEPPAASVPERFNSLVEVLRQIMDQLDQPYRKLPRHFDDAAWVSGRLVELLPLDMVEKQRFLEAGEPLDCLEALARFLRK